MTPTAVILCPCVDDLSVAKETRIDNIGLCVLFGTNSALEELITLPGFIVDVVSFQISFSQSLLFESSFCFVWMSNLLDH